MGPANSLSAVQRSEAPWPRSRWERYVLETDPVLIERALGTTRFSSAGRPWTLLRFELSKTAPSILISQGTSGHAYLFAELAHRIHSRGFNVFVMPKHGGATVTELVKRHEDAVRFLAREYNPRVGVFGEGLGGYVVFYLALAGAPVRSILCQNSPAILTEPSFHDALFRDHGGAARRRRLLVPIARILAKTAPRMKLRTSTYLDFRELVDSKPENHAIESALIDKYQSDEDFDRAYPMSSVASLVLTPPPAPLESLRVPTMFLVSVRGITPSYIRELFDRLPPIQKKLVEVDGSVFWMVSHPVRAAEVIGDWFATTL